MSQAIRWALWLPTLNRSAADETLKSGSCHPTARPSIWPGATLRISGCDHDADQPDRLAAFLDRSGAAECWQVNELDSLASLLVRSSKFGDLRCRHLLRRFGLVTRDDSLGNISREIVC
jgi:hypothetical protein